MEAAEGWFGGIALSFFSEQALGSDYYLEIFLSILRALGSTSL